ncbi:MAG TPA: CRTAC1 family protein [Tepidisphaeraceae bacterium]|nr:CRTAC1 family protein [Tepidisphaeraceae bacterium]
MLNTGPNSQRAETAAPIRDATDAEDFVSPDDAVIGRALRWSIAALLILSGVVMGTIWWAHRAPPPPITRLTDLSTTNPISHTVAEPPAVRFTDITKLAGIHFVHHNGAYGEKLLPETMGGGVAFLDYDNDGKPDLLFVNGSDWPGHGTSGSDHADHPATLALYHNDGNGHFTDVTAGSGLDVPIYGIGVAVGDYDNDGRVDIFITGVGGCRLFHNEGNGKFRDVTAEAGVGGSPQDWSTSAAFVDYDNDGRLDLFVCNYVRWSRDLDLKANYTLTGVGRAYGPPTNFEGAFCRLYHNDGNGHFTDVSAKAGIQVRNKDTGVAVGKSLAVVPIDLDGDGFIDFVVANDTVQNFVFHNKRDGTFEEVGAMCGVGFDSNGNARGAMGIDAGYFRNDTALGIAIGNFANEMMALYVSHDTAGPLRQFTDDAIAQGVGAPSRLPLKFGVFFFDYDLDGWLDLLCADGHLESEINKVQPSEHYQQAAQLYWNGGGQGAGFIPVHADKAGPDLFTPIVGRGCAYGDIDGDGDLDLVLTQIAGAPLLLRNDQHTGHHYLRLKLIGNGTTCNRDAIGAQVLVRVNGQLLRRQVMPTRGYLSQSELPVTIGLGAAVRPESVRVKWPGGAVQTLTEYNVDSPTIVRQAP